MKLYLSSVLAVLIAAPAAHCWDKQPPAVGETVKCDVNDDSASLANALGGVETMRYWDGNQRCAPGDDGSTERMAAGG